MQKAYRVLVADDEALLQKNTGNVWDSKKVVSGQSVQVAYAGKKLRPGKLYYWKVMVWDDQDTSSQWSGPAAWQMGLLSRMASLIRPGGYLYLGHSERLIGAAEAFFKIDGTTVYRKLGGTTP